MKNITVCVLARNEEQNLEELLPQLQFANNVLVIDDISTDQTAKIAKAIGARVLKRALKENFSAARNYALCQSRNDWVLFVDADERLSPELIKWLKEFEPSNQVSGYRFQRIDWFWGKALRYGEVSQVHVTRLVNSKFGKYRRPVHEVWESKLPVEKSNLVINHFPHQTIKAFLEHVNFYSSLNARYLASRNKSASVLDIIVTPVAKFVYTYFWKLGFLDGAPGFVYSFMMSFHSFLSRAKLYALKNK